MFCAQIMSFCKLLHLRPEHTLPYTHSLTPSHTHPRTHMHSYPPLLPLAGIFFRASFIVSQWRNADAAASAATTVSAAASASALTPAFSLASAPAPPSAPASADVANNWPFWPHRVVCCYRYCCQRAPHTPPCCVSLANSPAICSHVLQSCPASPLLPSRSAALQTLPLFGAKIN